MQSSENVKPQPATNRTPSTLLSVVMPRTRSFSTSIVSYIWLKPTSQQ